jgi:NCAIR mutase (PurE)-related protein
MTPPPGHNPGVTFLGFSGGLLALVVAALIALPILGMLACCGFGVGIVATTPTPTATP